MSKNLVVTAAGRTVAVPVKSIVAAEVAVFAATIGVSAAVGSAFGHPFIGALVGAAIVAGAEVAEFFAFKAAVKSGRISINVQ